MSSDRNGRALEYCLTKQLIEAFAIQRLSEQTQADQIRDQAKFAALPDSMQQYYRAQSDKFIHWLKQTKFTDKQPIAIERLTDAAAKRGDVTDIRLIYPPAHYNISLKHNHYAVKHQRPGALYKQLGIADKTKQRRYRQQLKSIEKNFFQQAQIINPDANTFKVIKAEKPQLIEQLYHQVCALVEDHINHQTQALQAQHFFEFLVGKTNFDKVIMTKDSIEVLSFNQIPLPQHVAAYHYDYNRIELEFDNGFKFDMRIHTASSRFHIGKSISLKFDTQLTSDNVPKLVI